MIPAVPETRLSTKDVSLLIDLSPAVHYVARATGDFGAVFISEGIRVQLGYEPSQFTEDAEFWASRIHPEDQPRVLAELGDLLTKEQKTIEYRFQHADGSWRWMHDELGLLRDEEGNALQIIGAWLDITARKSAEEALKESERKYRNIVDTTLEGIWTLDVEGRTTFVNARMAEMFGYEPEEMLGRTMYDFMDEDVREEARANMQKRRAGVEEEHDFCFQRKDGSDIWTRVAAVPMKDDNGNVIGALGMISDITERRRLEEELRLSEARLSEAQRIAKLGNWDWNLLTDEQWWSEERYRISGVDRTTYTPTHQSYLQTVHPDDRDRVVTAVAAALSTGAVYAIDYRIVLPDGSIKTIRSEGEVIRDEQGNPVRMAGTAQDVTERAELERQFLGAKEQERRRIGHDLHDGLGQELTGIALRLKSVSQTLAHDQSSQIQAIGDLTTMIQNAIAEVRRIALALTPGFSTSLEMGTALRGLAEETNNSSVVRCHVEDSNGGRIHDPDTLTHLYRIAQEAVNNAKKHANAKTIEVRFRCEGKTLLLEVLDDGIGIPSERERVEGMGLKSMRYRARILNGHLQIARRTHGGTRVLCSCPIPAD